MKFDELDAKMRIFETARDYRVLPGVYIVARIDGRGFTRLTKHVHRFAAPFDERFRDYMVATTEHLMGCGFNVVFGYTQSDEISLLFQRDETAFGRKTRKFNSILAGEASAAFRCSLAPRRASTAGCANSRRGNGCGTISAGGAKTPSATRSTRTAIGRFGRKGPRRAKRRTDSHACPPPTKTSCFPAAGSTSTTFPRGRSAGSA